MSFQEQICEAFCAGFTVRKVPIGYAIAAPFKWLDGDKLIFFARTLNNRIRFEDSGNTIFELEGAGVDFANPTRRNTLQQLCTEHEVTFDDDEALFFSEYVDASACGYAAIQFLSFMTRVQDLAFTAKSRVSSTFKEDLILAIEGRFGAEAEIQTNNAPVPAMAYYTVDIVVRHKNGKTAAIFPATSEEKALSATLFAKEIELKSIDNVIPFLVYDGNAGKKISIDTQAKAMNSELELANWALGDTDALDKIYKHVSNR